MTGWDDLRFLLAVCRGGTLTAAARELGLSQPTASRRMAALAARHPGLFELAGGRYLATAAGRAVARRAERIERGIHALAGEVDVLDARPEAAVRLTAPEGLGLAVIAPRLAELRRAHPDIALVLHAETQIVDLSRREADVALRFVRPSQRELVIRRLASIPFGLYAGERYQRAPGEPLDVVALHESMESPEARWLREAHPTARVRVRVRSTLATRAAILAGAGAGVLPDYLADDPALRPLGPAAVHRDVFVVYHRALRGSQRLRAVVRFAAACLSSGPRGPILPA